MDYFRHVKGFRKKRLTNPISANAICLYYILLEYDNELYFLEWFTAANSMLQALTNLSLSALQRARNELIQKGYLEYRKGKGNRAGSYHLIELSGYFEQQCEAQSAAQTTDTAPTLKRHGLIQTSLPDQRLTQVKIQEDRAACARLEKYLSDRFGALDGIDRLRLWYLVREHGEACVLEVAGRMQERAEDIRRPVAYLTRALKEEAEE